MKYQPRDIGCNRFPIYENGTWIRDSVKPGFYFKDFDQTELFTKILEMCPNFELKDLALIETGPGPNAPKRFGHVTNGGFLIWFVNRENG